MIIYIGIERVYIIAPRPDDHFEFIIYGPASSSLRLWNLLRKSHASYKYFASFCGRFASVTLCCRFNKRTNFPLFTCANDE